MPRACSLLTGGKDSFYALYRALRDGMEVACIATFRSAREDSWMFHTANIDLAVLVTRALGLEGVHRVLPVSGVKEREVDEMLEHLRRLKAETGFDVIVVGAVASRYQRERVERVAGELGVGVYAPQWGMDPEEYMRTLAREGIVFIITSITTYGLPPRLLGVPATGGVVEEILGLARRHGFHPAFEGGEAETLVVDSPLHSRGMVCLKGRRVRRAEFEYILSVEEAWVGRGEPCIVVDGEALL